MRAVAPGLASKLAGGRGEVASPFGGLATAADTCTVSVMKQSCLGYGIVAWVALALVAPGTAHADGVLGERAADDLLLTQVDIAERYWAKQGVTGCPDGIEARIADDLSDPADGPEPDREPATSPAYGKTWPVVETVEGLGGDCEIIILSEITDETRRYLHQRRVFQLRRDALKAECSLVVHEVRHALPGGTTGGVDGDGHSASGVMAAEDDGTVPEPCRRWALRVDRQERINAALRYYERRDRKRDR